MFLIQKTFERMAQGKPQVKFERKPWLSSEIIATRTDGRRTTDDRCMDTSLDTYCHAITFDYMSASTIEPVYKHLATVMYSRDRKVFVNVSLLKAVQYSCLTNHFSVLLSLICYSRCTSTYTCNTNISLLRTFTLFQRSETSQLTTTCATTHTYKIVVTQDHNCRSNVFYFNPCSVSSVCSLEALIAPSQHLGNLFKQHLELLSVFLLHLVRVIMYHSLTERLPDILLVLLQELVCRVERFVCLVDVLQKVDVPIAQRIL